MKAELDAYLKEQRKRLGSSEVKYWGSKDKDRCVFQGGVVFLFWFGRLCGCGCGWVVYGGGLKG